MTGVNSLPTRISSGCHGRCGTFAFLDTKYYDQIITKLHIRSTEEYKHNIQSLQNLNKIQGGEGQELHNQTRSCRRRRRILLVDDEPDICMVYQIVLEDAGYECKAYTDSVAALEEFKPSYYDLILLDIKMPILNGFELCEKIVELDKAVHIVFITASEEYYEKFRTEHFPELGKINYIQKPIGNEELVEIVHMIIENSITID